MIYLLIGPIRTGKTNALKNWISKRADVDGLLSPNDAKGTRYFYEIGSGVRFPFEADATTEEPTVAIGPFLFLSASFERANSYLMEAINHNDATYLVVDELGKLELKGQGLHPAIEALVQQYQLSDTRHVILVVRDTLVKSAIASYKLSHYQLIEKAQLSEL